MTQYAQCRAIQIVDTFDGQGKLGFFEKRKANQERKGYIAAVTDALDIIGNSKVGRRLFVSLAKHGKPVTIMMPDYQQAIRHRSACTSSATAKAQGSDVFRQPNGESAIGRHPVLKAAVQRNGVRHERLVAYMNGLLEAGGSKKKPIDAKEFKTIMQSSPDDFPPGLERNRLFSPLGDYPLGFYCKLAVEAELPHGDGAACTVRFDPYNDLGGTRRVDVALFHELVHAWHAVSGRKIFTDDDRENEYMTIGLHGFQCRHTGHPRIYTENAYRAELGLPARTSAD